MVKESQVPGTSMANGPGVQGIGTHTCLPFWVLASSLSHLNSGTAGKKEERLHSTWTSLLIYKWMDIDLLGRRKNSVQGSAWCRSRSRLTDCGPLLSSVRVGGPISTADQDYLALAFGDLQGRGSQTCLHILVP